MLVKSKLLRMIGLGLMFLVTISCTPVNPLTVSSNKSNISSNNGSSGGSTSFPIIRADVHRGTTSSYGTIGSVGSACWVDAYSSVSMYQITITAASLTIGGGTVIPLAPNGGTMQFYDGGTGWSYTPGTVYTVSVTIDGLTYSDSIVAPGSATIPPFSAPGPITWPISGSNDYINICYGSCTSTTAVGPPVASGAVSTASSIYFPISGTYQFSVHLWQTKSPAFGATGVNAPWSHIWATDQYNYTDTK